MKQNNPCYLFSMYEPDTDSVIVKPIKYVIIMDDEASVRKSRYAG